MISSVFLVWLALAGVVAADFPAARPDPASRTYTSYAINSLIDNLTPLFSDPELAVSIYPVLYTFALCSI